MATQTVPRTSLVDTPVNYKITRLDNQELRPGWTYEWILPEGGVGEFLSNPVGFPYVTVNWLEVSSGDSYFTLQCRVGTGGDCESTVNILVKVMSEATQLSVSVTEETNQCRITERPLEYLGYSPLAKSISWQATNGYIILPNGTQIQPGEVWIDSDPFQGNSRVKVSWGRTPPYLLSAVGKDINQQTSLGTLEPVLVKSTPTYSLSGPTEMTIGEGTSAVFTALFEEIQRYPDEFKLVLYAWVGYRKPTGPYTGGANDYTGPNWRLGGTPIVLVSPTTGVGFDVLKEGGSPSFSINFSIPVPSVYSPDIHDDWKIILGYRIEHKTMAGVCYTSGELDAANFQILYCIDEVPIGVGRLFIEPCLVSFPRPVYPTLTAQPCMNSLLFLKDPTTVFDGCSYSMTYQDSPVTRKYLCFGGDGELGYEGNPDLIICSDTIGYQGSPTVYPCSSADLEYNEEDVLGIPCVGFLGYQSDPTVKACLIGMWYYTDPIVTTGLV